MTVSLRGDTGWVPSHPWRTGRAVVRRLADGVSVSEELVNQVRPRHEQARSGNGKPDGSSLPRLLMCVDCERQVADDLCPCGGSRLVDVMTCDGCGATEVPSELIVGEMHGNPGSARSCQGRWRVEL